MSATRRQDVDLLRGAAVQAMIAAHSCHAYLDDRYRHNDFWYAVDIGFGFVAPLFLFLSGWSLYLALGRSIGNGEPLRALAHRLLRRALVVLLLGYWLQIPVLSLRQLVWVQRPEELTRLFDSNILHVIAIASCCILLLVVSRRDARQGARGGAMSTNDPLRLPGILAAGLAVAVVVATPYVMSSEIYRSLPLPLTAMFAPQPRSTFPLFPYASYLFAGFAIAPVLASLAGKRKGWLAIGGTGGMMVAGAMLLDQALAADPTHGDFWGSSIQHTMFRTGGVALAVAIALWWNRLQKRDGGSTQGVPAGSREPIDTDRPANVSSGGSLLEFAGRRALAFYLLHLMLIYGSPMNMGSRYWFRGALASTLHPIETIVATFVVSAVCYLLLSGWDRLREQRPLLALWLWRGWWILFWSLFLLIP